MSGDLVKRLRNTPNWMREGFQDWKDSVRTYDRAPFEAADRIEELQAQRNFAQRQVVIAEAKLAKAVEALELALELADNDLVDFSEYGLSCDADINERYRTTLTELKGQDDAIC